MVRANHRVVPGELFLKNNSVTERTRMNYTFWLNLFCSHANLSRKDLAGGASLDRKMSLFMVSWTPCTSAARRPTLGAW